MLKPASAIVAALAIACTDALAPERPEIATVDMLKVSAGLDVLSERPGWAFVRVGVTIKNPTDQTVSFGLPLEPRSCVLVRSYRERAATPSETPAAGCRERSLLRPRASTRLSAEPTLSFGPPPYPTTTGETIIVTAEVLDISINHAPPLSSGEVYAGTVRVQWGTPPP